MAKGFKTGGRQKGSVNKKTLEQMEAVKEAGLTPLEYLLSVMREDIPTNMEPADKARLIDRKIDAAKAAAPYVHHKLTSVEMTAEITSNNARDITEAELLNIATSGSTGDTEAQESQDQVH